jgi:allantoinase
VHDVVVRGGTVVTPEGSAVIDIGVDDGRIAVIGAQLPGGREEIDATGQTILPAVIDVHVHFNEPGRTDWEGAATGSRGLAAGGGALFIDMPLNSAPCTLTAADVDLKRAALEAASVTDFALWGGLVPGHVSDMAAMAERGVIGFKAFMSDSGLPEFARADAATLLEGMREAARLNLPVAVHAESEELTKELARQAPGQSARDFVRSRPVLAELEAIERALLFADDTGAALHIVHVSCGRGVALAFAARERGVNVSIETCPHYLTFTEDDLEALGTIAKCAPPLRARSDQEALWSELLRGHVDLVGSDHSPTDPALKAKPFMAAWGGIAGVQSTLAVLLEEGYQQRGLPLERIARLLAAAPAQRFRLPRKGTVAVGQDADLVLIDLDAAFTLESRDLAQRHKNSPYVGRRFRGRVHRTLRRGETIYRAGHRVGESRGRFVRPSFS